MKKLILALLAMGSISAANAQKNTVLLYGNASFSTERVDYGAYDVRTTTWGINPGIGYQLTNHMTVGLQGGYNRHKTPTDGSGVQFPNSNVNTQSLNTLIQNDWSAGIFWRYTMYIGNTFFVYHQTDLSFISGRTFYEGLPPTASYNGFYGDMYPAVGMFIHKGLALNFNIGGLAYRTTSADAGTLNSATLHDNTFVATIGRVFNIGASLNIGCHSHHMHGHHEPGDETRHMNTTMSNDDDDSGDYSSRKARLKAKRERQKVKIKSDDDE